MEAGAVAPSTPGPVPHPRTGMLRRRRWRLLQMEKDFIFSEFVLSYGIIWELEKIGNSDLLYQTLKKNRKRKVKIVTTLPLISVSPVAGQD